MSGVGPTLRRLAAELVGLIADDWRLPLGIVVVLGCGWIAVSRGASAGSGFLVAGAIGVLVGAVAVVDGRHRRAAAAARLDSGGGGRVPDRDR